MRDLSIKLQPVFIQLLDGSFGPQLSTGYSRLVTGGRGSYLEIPDSCLDKSLIEVEPGEEYRLTEYWKVRAFYAHYRTSTAHRKLYFQYKPVSYADYEPGYWYISHSHVLGGPWYEEVSGGYLGGK